MKEEAVSQQGEVERAEDRMAERKEGRDVPSCVGSLIDATGAPTTLAGSSTTATCAMESTLSGNVPTTCSRGKKGGEEKQQDDGRRLQFMRFAFSTGEVGHSPSVTYMETAFPVPTVPWSDLQYKDISDTIAKYPYLFKVITPIHVDELEHILSQHPNCALVKSICDGFHNGFWPFVDTEDPGRQPVGAVMWKSDSPDLDDESIDFLRWQRDLEIKLNCYSEGFGGHLLPGMTAQPIFMAPKKGSLKLQLINDHSVGSKSLNSLIPAEGGFVKLDTLSNLIANICAWMRENGGVCPVFVWKSDASQAYQ